MGFLKLKLSAQTSHPLLIKVTVCYDALFRDPGCLGEFESVGSESLLRAAPRVQRQREMSLG